MPVPGAQGPESVLAQVQREIERTRLRAHNHIPPPTRTSARGLGVGRSPKDVIWQSGAAELWHYHNDKLRQPVPLLIVFSLISRSYILDLVPGNSFIEHLTRAGLDVYMVDWGEPHKADAQNSFEHYVDFLLPRVIDAVLENSGAQQVNLLGYCFGGVLALMYAARHPGSPVHSLTVLACPVDFTRVGQMSELFGDPQLDPDTLLADDGNVPADVIARGFRPPPARAGLANYADMWQRLWEDPDAAAYLAIAQWASDHIAFPGTAMQQTIHMLFRDNAFMCDQLALSGEAVHLAGIKLPFLAVLGTKDEIVPEAAAMPVMDLVGSAHKDLLRLPRGHIGLVAGHGATNTSIPIIVERLVSRSGHCH